MSEPVIVVSDCASFPFTVEVSPAVFETRTCEGKGRIGSGGPVVLFTADGSAYVEKPGHRLTFLAAPELDRVDAPPEAKGFSFRDSAGDGYWPAQVYASESGTGQADIVQVRSAGRDNQGVRIFADREGRRYAPRRSGKGLIAKGGEP